MNTTPDTPTASPNSSDRAKPSHYQRLSPQPIVVIEAWGLKSFHLGNVIKYIARAKHKGEELRDLRKARWYLDRYIVTREAESAGEVPPTPGDQA